MPSLISALPMTWQSPDLIKHHASGSDELVQNVLAQVVQAANRLKIVQTHAKIVAKLTVMVATPSVHRKHATWDGLIEFVYLLSVYLVLVSNLDYRLPSVSKRVSDESNPFRENSNNIMTVNRQTGSVMIAKILGISLFWDDMIHQPVVSSNLKPSNATVKFEHQSMQVTIIIEALLPFAILFYFIFIFIFLATSISIEPTIRRMHSRNKYIVQSHL